jgi:hypothetical protein
MNPFVRYSLAVAMGSTVATSAFAAEEIDTPTSENTPQTEAELSTEQQQTLDLFEKELQAAISSGSAEGQIADLIASTIANNPELAAAIQVIATNAQAVSQEILTAAVIQGLSQAPETAAGNPTTNSVRLPLNTPQSSSSSGGSNPLDNDDEDQVTPEPIPDSTGGGEGSASGG